MTAVACAWAMLAASGAAAQDRYNGTFALGSASVSYSLLFDTGFSGAVNASDLLSGSTFTFADPTSPITFTYDQATNGQQLYSGTSPGFVFYSQGVNVGGGSVTFDFADSNAVFGIVDRDTGSRYNFCAAGNVNVCGIEVNAGGALIFTPGTFGVQLISTSRVIATADPSVTAPAVPEPASWAMMIVGAGLTGAALRVRRRRVTFAAA